MSLQKRIEQLEHRTSAKEDFPLCIFLVGLTADDEVERAVQAYGAGDRSWTRRERESAEQFKKRVAGDVEATGKPTLVCAQYEEVAA